MPEDIQDRQYGQSIICKYTFNHEWLFKKCENLPYIPPEVFQ